MMRPRKKIGTGIFRELQDTAGDFCNAGNPEAPNDIQSRPLVLHLSADYPNSRRNRTTSVVQNLVTSTPGFDHVVISLKRQANPLQAYFFEDSSSSEVRVFAFGYWGLPFGLAHLASMWLAASRIFTTLNKLNVRPQLIHAHKLTFEGMIAWFLAKRLAIPFVVSLRGEAETKIVRFKPTYRPLVRQIARDARAVFGVSMWFVPRLRELVPAIGDKVIPLPNIGPVPPDRGAGGVPYSPRFVTVMDLNVYRKKGFHWLVPAFAAAARNHPNATLDVIGWSSDKVMSEARRLVAKAGCEEQICFRGSLPHAQVLEDLPAYTALLLPSTNETFGMVYVEALFAGLPVLYTAGTGIDGHLEGLGVGIKVRQGNLDDISAGIRDLAENAALWKTEVIRRRAELADRFGRDEIVSRYATALRGAIRAGHAAA
jgi:glycosyltransferase involved in cell wall biosynthesis